MNKIIASALAISIVSSIAYAGPRFEVTPMVGKKLYNYSDDAPRFDDGEALVGVRANAYINDQVSVQLGAEASKDNKQGTGTPTADHGAMTDLERGMANVQVDIPTKGRITPFVMVGGGYEKLHRSEPSTNSDSQAFYNAGAGLRYSVNDRVDLVGEARVIHKVEDKDTDAIGSVGLGLKFGNTAPASPPVKALDIKELATITPPAAPVVVSHVEEEIKPVSEIVSTKVVYDTNDVNVCDVTTGKSHTGVVRGSGKTCDSSNIRGIYVQVIALNKNSPDVIISRLKAKGYKHVLKDEGSLTRVLVGPYANRAAASAALRGLKQIRSDAFIYQAR